MRKILKSLSIFRVLLAISLTFFVSACEEKSPAPSQPKMQQPAQQPKAPVQTNQTQSKNNRYVWPPVAAKDEEIVLAQNLFAKNYFLVLDDSGSMNDKDCADNKRKIDAAKIALAKFANLVPESANLGLMSFDDRKYTEWVPLGVNDKRHKELFASSLKPIEPVDGTPLHNAVAKGFNALEKQAQKQLGYGEYHFVIITDGQANSGQEPEKAVDFILNNTPIVIHTIGFCIGTDNSLNQPGRTIYATATNPQELSQGLQDVLAESASFSDIGDFKQSK